MATRDSNTLETAVGHHQAGRLAEAEEIYRRILAVEPGCAQAWHFLGVVSCNLGQAELGVEQIGRSLELQEADPDAHNHLGLAYQALKRPMDAIASYRRALELQPNFSDAYYNCGNAFKELGKLNEAASCYRRALELNPDLVEAYNNLGTVLRDQGALDEAAACFRQALSVMPDDAEVHFNLGLVAQDWGKSEEAIACYRRAVELQPDLAEGHNNLGTLLLDQGDLEEASKCVERALELKADYAEAHNNRGKVFYENCQWEAAGACFERALQLKPAYAEAWNSLGHALRHQGELVDADRCYSRALELKPDFAEAHCSKSILLLSTGDLVRGWQEYEWRWKTKRSPSRNFRQPVWRGQLLESLTILLHTEQGLGDTLQFIRYAPLVKQFGGTVLVECEKHLWKLLARCPGIDRLIAAGEQLPSFDVHAPLLSLPRILKTSMESIPAEVPYIFADEALIALWRDKLGANRLFRIGINWHGRPGRGYWRERDIPLVCFARLSRVPNVQLISLQKGEGQLELARSGLPIVDLGEEVDTVNGAFMDTAAIMKNLDLVITTDTSAAHLAGALGVPVWVALPFVADWRWLLDRSDSPWYPTMRLFRQRRLSDWTTVMDEIESSLRHQLTSGD
jgi:tetratricopeptide (TPR) repeat protein